LPAAEQIAREIVSERYDPNYRPALELIAHDFTRDLLRLGIFARGDALLGQFHAALAKPFHRFVMLVGGGERVREETYGDAVFIVRFLKLFRLHRELRAGQCTLPLHDRGLPASHFMLGDSVHILRSGTARKRGEQGRN